MDDAHGGMATACEGMNETSNGIKELTSVLRRQSERIDHFVEAMTYLSASVAPNVNHVTSGSFPPGQPGTLRARGIGSYGQRLSCQFSSPG